MLFSVNVNKPNIFISVHLGVSLLKRGTFLITPALKWVNGKYAEAYHQLLETEIAKDHFVKRRTSVEPLFNLVAKMIDATGMQKQLSVQWYKKRTNKHRIRGAVCTDFNDYEMRGHPLRGISQMRAAFS